MIKITAKEIAKLINRSTKYVYILFRRKGITIKEDNLELVVDLICKYRWRDWATKTGIRRSYQTGCCRNYARRLYQQVFQPLYRKCFERYNYQCQLCSGKNMLVIHHKDHNHYNMELNNLMVVCWECHTKIHWGRC